MPTVQAGPLGSGTSALVIGARVGPATASGANLAFLTDGPNSRIIGSNASGLLTNRNITVNPIPGSGSVVLGGFTDDYTAFNGAVQLNGPATFYAAQLGRVDFTGPISGSGAVQIGGTAYVEGAGTTGIQLGSNGTIAFTALANSFSGATTVASGRLLVSGSLYAASPASTVTVSAGTLGGTGTIGGLVTIANTTMIEAGMTAGSPPTLSPLTLANGLTVPYSYQNGTSVVFQFDSLGPAGSPGLVVYNGLNNVGNTSGAANTQEILITGAISGTGTYALIQTDPGDAGTLANAASTTFTLGVLPNRAQGSLQINPTNPQELDLVVTGLYSVAWTGLHSDWNALGSFAQTGGTDNYGKFQPGDAVVFSDSAAVGGTTNVTLNSGNVLPSSMTFQNQTSTYTISGTASITGNTGLSLTNGGTLIIENTDTFTGLTSIGPGATLQLGNSGVGSDGYLPDTTISDSGSLVYSLTGQQTFGNPITGPGALQLNSGALTLTSTGNSFSGGTTISGGTLQIGDGLTTNGSLLGQVSNNSLLVFADYTAQTFGGTISGNGAVTKSGPGLLTLTNSNGYTGGTTISGGTLQLGNGQAGQDGSLAATGVVADNGVFAFNYASNETFAGAISGNGALTTLGSRMLTLANIETYSGPTTISAGTLVLGNGLTSGAVAGNVLNNSALVFNSPTTQTYSGVISGSGAVSTVGGNYLRLTRQNTYSGATTVSGGTLSLIGGSLYSNLTWANSSVVTVNQSGVLEVAAWSDNDTGTNPNSGLGHDAFTANNLVLNGGTVRYVGTTTAGGNYDRSFTIGPNGAALDASGAVTFQLLATRNVYGFGLINNTANGPLTLEGTTNGLLGLAYSGGSNLTKSGPGTWTISGANTYTGGTTVNAGVLIAANTGALPGYTAGGSIVVNTGATLAVTAGTNAGEFSLTTGGGVNQVLQNATFEGNTSLGIQVNAPENVTYGTPIADSTNGPLGFVKLGTGILSLTGNNTYSGGTQVNGGVLIATAVNTLGLSGGQPAYQFAGRISVNGAGSTLVVQAGTSPGEFQPGNVSNVLNNVAFGTGTVFGIQVVSGDSFSYGSSIPDGTSGTAGLCFYKLGAGTLTLAAQNNYSGTTTIGAGVLVAGAAGALGNGATIQLGDNYTGSTPAQLLISGANTFSQNITVNAASATLGNIDDNNAGFSGNITLNSSLTIASASVSSVLTFSGNIVHGSGTNSVTLSGPGNVVFLGNATYQGATTINGGYLTVGATGSLPASTTLNINNASTVELDNTAQTLVGLNGSPGSTLYLAYANGATLTVGGGSFAGTINDNQNIANLVKNTTGHPVPHRTKHLLRLDDGHGRRTAVRFHEFRFHGCRPELDHGRDLRGRRTRGDRLAQPAALPH